MKKIKRIAVLTSGGDAPGMNAALRAVVRTGTSHNWEVYGVKQGFAGLIKGNWSLFGPRDVSGIIQLGGTILGSARCPEFKEVSVRDQALKNLKKDQIDALIVIGGNGSQTGANALHEMGFPTVGIASTIDNDLYGTDISIGVDTAINIALENIDRLRVTATSHNRVFLIEVMGRHCGYLALLTGLAGGSEMTLVPEQGITPDQMVQSLCDCFDRGKDHALVVVAEGFKYKTEYLASYFKEHCKHGNYDLRVTTLGHVQRGGTPTAFDRILASRLGAAATETLAQGEAGLLIGLVADQICKTPLKQAVIQKKELDADILKLARVLER